jgi:hypothetical protein
MKKELTPFKLAKVTRVTFFYGAFRNITEYLRTRSPADFGRE